MHILNNFMGHSEILTYYPNVKAFLWDMDGTIMETERMHARATINLLKSFNSDQASEYESIHDFCTGLTDPQLFAELIKLNYLPQMQTEEFIQQKNVFLYELMHSTPKSEIFSHQILELITNLKQLNIPQAVVTSSEREVAKKFLGFLELEEFFDFLIAREDVSHNKPHPMPYTIAIERLGLEAHEVCIFEDSIPGLEAARSSGANVFHVKWYQDFLNASEY